MHELKEELSEEFKGIAASVSMKSKCPAIEIVIYKPDDWASMNILEKKCFIVNFFVERDLIKVEVQDAVLD